MEHRTELLRLLSSLFDGQLDEAEQARLQELLADESNRRLYLQYVDMHARLLTHPVISGSRTLSGVDALAGVINPVAMQAIEKQAAAAASPRSRFAGVRRVVSYVAVAAATLAASIFLQLVMSGNNRPHGVTQPPVVLPSYVATLSQAAGVEWGPATAAYRSGSRVLNGELELRRGVARLSYDGGIELIVEGPARLRLESTSAASLLSGKVVFRADDASAPFTLTTPSSILVDLGTEYAVEVDANQEEVHVFSGEVRRVAKAARPNTQPELLAAGEARRYDESSTTSGEVASLEPAKFVRQLPAASTADSASGLLAYEGFEYANEAALRDEAADGGSGFVGSWCGGFARAVNEKQGDRIALNIYQGLVRHGSANVSLNGSFEHIGFAKYFRKLAVPIRLDSDGIYYVSYLFRREGPPLDELNDVSIQFRESDELDGDQRGESIDMRKRLNFGVDRTNELYTHLERIGRRTPLPLSYGETYLLVAKVVASGAYPDQVFVRVYGPQEPVEPNEPANWSAIGPPIQSDLVFDWLEIHINSHTRQSIDEIRIGTTWPSVAAAWLKEK